MTNDQPTPFDEIRSLAIAHGMPPLEDQRRALVCAGLVSLQDIVGTAGARAADPSSSDLANESDL